MARSAKLISFQFQDKAVQTQLATSSTDPFRFSYSNDAPPNIRPPFLHMDSSSTVEEEDRIVATYRDQPITEGSKLMNAIAGTSTVHSDTLDFENQGRIMFIFSVRIVPRSPSLILVSGRNTSLLIVVM